MAFNVAYVAAKKKKRDAEGAESARLAAKADTEGALRHLAKLRPRFNKKTALTGVLTGEGLLANVARSEVGVWRALADRRSGAFATKAFDRPFAESFAAQWITFIDTTGASPRFAADLVACASRAASSAPGPDGLPYRAWSAAGPAAGETLEQAGPLAAM